MAKVKQYTANGDGVNSFGSIASSIVGSAKQTVDEQSFGSAIALENFNNEASISQQENTTNTLIQQIDQKIATESAFAGTEYESLTPAQLRAGATVAIAAHNPQGYFNAAMSDSYPALENNTSDMPFVGDGNHGNYEVTGKPALEYFDTSSLDSNMAASFQFNIEASRQNDFAETILPTITLDPSEVGIIFDIDYTVVHRAVRHALDEKDNVEYDRRNLLDGETDPSILDDASVEFVPYVMEDGTNSDNFVPSSLYEPTIVNVGDYSVPTAPLSSRSESHRLLSLSAHPKLVSNGVLNQADSLTGRVELKAMYFKVRKQNAPEKDAQLIRVVTENTPRSTFNKSPEGDARELELNFRDAHFTLHGDSKDVNGNSVIPADLLADKDYTLTYTANFNATLNIETGYEVPNPGRVRKTALHAADGTQISHTEGAGKTIADTIVIEFEGYEYKATRSNLTRRSTGIFVDNVIKRERGKIQHGSPFTAQLPVGEESRDYQRKMKGLINAVRSRTNGMAVTKILNVTETLKSVVAGYNESNEFEIPHIEGIGRYYARPFYDERHINVNNLVSSLDSKDVDVNLAATILGIVREQTARGMIESRMQPAIEMLSGYTLTRPQYILGTDIYIGQFLERNSKPQLLGENFITKIVTTNNKNFRGRLQWFPKVTEGTDGINPLNFGNHFWVPELITDTAAMPRQGAITREVTVQPRNTHIIHNPHTGVVFIEGIRELMNSRAAQANIELKPLGGDDEQSGNGDGDLVIGDLRPDNGDKG